VTLLELRERVARAGATREDLRGRPLVIACGLGKLPGVHRVDALYTGPSWSIYRKGMRDRVVRGLGLLSYDVYVLSAEYGIVPVDRRIASYDKVLKERPKKPNEVGIAAILSLLRRQVREHGLVEVDVSGGELYADALAQAGLVVHRLDTRGIGYQNGALKAHLLR